jgi:hypothetical protein
MGEAARAIDALRWLADERVRPTSQQLADAAARLAVPPADDPQTSLSFPEPRTPMIEKKLARSLRSES